MWKKSCQHRKKIYLIYCEWRYKLSYQNHKIIRDSGVLIDGVNEIVNNELTKPKGGFLGALLAPLKIFSAQQVISSVVKDISGRGIRRAERRYIDQNILFISIL